MSGSEIFERTAGAVAGFEIARQLQNGAPPAPDLELLARTMADLTREVERLSAYCSRVAERCEALVAVQSAFNSEDVELIKAHVRHPGALEAARLKERIRCACVALADSRNAVAMEILKGEV